MSNTIAKWTMSRYDKESRTAAAVLESMYNGSFTVEVSAFEGTVSNSVVAAIDETSSEESFQSAKKRLNLDKIAQPIDEHNEHLKEIFGGKIPSFLMKQLAAHMNKDDKSDKIVPRKRKPYAKRPATLEKLEKISRPPNSFMVFAQEYRSILALEYPQCKNKEISVKLGQLWRSLDQSAKKYYEERADEIALEHKRKNPCWSINVVADIVAVAKVW